MAGRKEGDMLFLRFRPDSFLFLHISSRLCLLWFTLCILFDVSADILKRPKQNFWSLSSPVLLMVLPPYFSKWHHQADSCTNPIPRSDPRLLLLCLPHPTILKHCCLYRRNVSNLFTSLHLQCYHPSASHIIRLSFWNTSLIKFVACLLPLYNLFSTL